ncbi:MAG: hypothetical protein JWM78_3454 [Verrucomicrobiaceae bacterium]|nr:hypothetical protein [Verrucomicrobiaceae bacterium]
MKAFSIKHVVVSVAIFSLTLFFASVLAADDIETEGRRVLFMNKADAAKIASVVYDEAGWLQFKSATLYIWQGGVASPMGQAHLLRPGDLNIHRDLDTLTAFYNTPVLKKALNAVGFTPQTYAIWDKGLIANRVAVGLTKGFVKQPPPASAYNTHDANYRFVWNHRDDIDAFDAQLMQVMTEGAIDDGEDKN